MPKTRRDDTLFTPAGDMRHRVTLVVESTIGVTWGTRGEVDIAHTREIPTFAKLENLGGGEGVYVRQMFPTASHRITIRYDSRVNMRTRITRGSDTYHVLSIENIDERDRELVMVCGREA